MDKTLYGGIEETEEFGEKLYLKGEEKLGAKRVLVCGSGAMEKNIDIIIGRRFKKRGMSWSKEGGK